ncbi:hypothetical protein FRX31_008115 [Thalictrum thalictroides]|uniref:Uncharacterized protein n=1 Tax=Thalictrum thalictroides TaxID=46969 RepID=A0A7J6WXW8_THATH|nr:hypothetical protein FRX31_021128 [Thalictrum thalictroides]KAF5202296.1 hypothetical protein FRX31_008115 [Thalictrum thalictroides]
MPLDADSYSDSGAGANSDSSSEDGVDDAEGKQERAMAMRRHRRCGFRCYSWVLSIRWANRSSYRFKMTCCNSIPLRLLDLQFYFFFEYTFTDLRPPSKAKSAFPPDE